MNQYIGKKSLLLLCAVAVFASAQMRVVSLGPSVTRTMTALGIESYIVGNTQYCEFENPTKSVTIGSMLEINIEAILALSPDHVFAVGLTPQKVVDKLKKFGLSVSVIDDPVSFEMLCSNMRTVAKQCNLTARADSLIVDATERVAKTRKKYASDTPVSVMIQLVANPPYAVLDSTLGAELIEVVGGRNVATGLASGYLSRESVLALNPDVILLPDMDGGAVEEKKAWLAFEHLSAVQRKQVFIVDRGGISAPSVSLFAKTVEEIGAMIHGK